MCLQLKRKVYKRAPISCNCKSNFTFFNYVTQWVTGWCLPLLLDKTYITTIDNIRVREIVNWAKEMHFLSHNLLHDLLCHNWLSLNYLILVVWIFSQRYSKMCRLYFIQAVLSKCMSYKIIISIIRLIVTVISFPKSTVKWCKQNVNMAKPCTHFLCFLLYHSIVLPIHKLLQRSIVEMKVCGYLWWEDN